MRERLSLSAQRGESSLVGGSPSGVRADYAHGRTCGQADGSGALRDSLLPSLFFTDTLQMKAWLVTAAMVLACGQLLTAARIYELLRFPPKGRFYHSVHRWSGRAAIVVTLPVAYHCVFLLGFGTHSPRVLIHSLLGSALYGAVVAKVLMVRSTRFAPWVLPVAGSLLFSILLGLWLTSALWFFTTAPATT
jgi:hypothetical protein